MQSERDNLALFSPSYARQAYIVALLDWRGIEVKERFRITRLSGVTYYRGPDLDDRGER